MNTRRNLLLALILVLLLPLNASASQQSNQYYPPSNSDYFMKKFSWQLYASIGINKIRFTQFDKNNEQVKIIDLETNGNSFYWVDFYCTGDVSIEFLDSDEKTKDIITRGKGTTYLDNSSCKYDSFVKVSNYDENKKQYKDDTFGKKNNKK